MSPPILRNASSPAGGAHGQVGLSVQAAASSPALDRVVRLAATLLDVPLSAVSVVSDDRHTVFASHWMPETVRRSSEFPRTHSLCRRVVAQDAPLLIADTETSAFPEAQRSAADFDLGSYAGVPLRSRAGEVLGTLFVGDSGRRDWTAAETEILEQLSEVAALEIELRADLRSATERDPVSGLPNGASCEQHIAEAQLIADARGSAVAVLVVELTNLPLVVDGLGRVAGERLVHQVARRLQSQLSDLIVGHLGAERFVIISDERDEHAALRLADRVREVLREPADVGQWPLPLVSCIGIALGEPGDVPSELIDAGVAAVHEAREAPNDVRGGGGKSMRERAVKRLGVDTALRHGVETDEFTVHFQPLYNLRRGTLSGFEALARWHSPQLGPVSPVDFIPIAETSGLIVVLGRRVLETACLEAAAWPRRADGGGPGVSVNISPGQLSAELPRQVTEVLQATGLAPHRLTLELTESALVSMDGVGSGVLTELRALGIHLALDDFGTGFASLNHLARLPLNVIKIDRSFIQRLDEPRTHAIVTATIAMARELELSVTAEGIEGDALRQQVTALGCTHGQGFGLGRPDDAAAARALAVAAAT